MRLSRRIATWGSVLFLSCTIVVASSIGAHAQDDTEEHPPRSKTTLGVGGGAGGAFGGKRVQWTTCVKQQDTAIALALEWLKNHQSEEGHWACADFSSQCRLNKCPGPGEAAYTPGVTGLATLAFLGAGETHQSGPYKESVQRALKYLKSIQDTDGCFGPRTSMQFQYNHGYAALAMTEAYGLTGARLFKGSAQRGVGFVLKSQNPYLAWRYGVRDGDNDTSVTTVMTMVLKSAQMAELEVDATAFKGAVAWMDKMTDPETGRVGYQNRGGPPQRTVATRARFPVEHSESLTAMGVLTRVFAGQDPRETAILRKSADLVASKPPRWDPDAGTTDLYYWYFGTLSLSQVGGDGWKRWKAALRPALLDNQGTREGRDERGSWDPVGPWGSAGGRVAATALTCLILESCYEHTIVRGTPKKK